MHCDTMMQLWKDDCRKEEAVNLYDCDYSINIKKMIEGKSLAQCFALYLPWKKSGKPAYQILQEMHDVFLKELDLNAEYIKQATTADEILKNDEAGFLSAVLTIEDGAFIEDKIERIDEVYDWGVRMIGIIWNHENTLAYPNSRDAELHNLGLKPFGFECIERMKEKGIIVDVSHLSDAGFYDVYNNTEKPFVASHSNAREVCPFVRNLTDDMIRKLGKRGGVTGLNYCRDFLFTSAEEKEIVYDNYLDITCNKLAEHAKHIVNVGGMGVLGLGSDFDGIHAYVGMPKADKMDHLANALHKNGFTEGQIDDIFYGNVMRVYREVL